ncbi:hypothetical protein [Novosphingobium sp. TH158]|uniref:hypothetical protein n=1 Tax=Novosphingobium sp. TH158 TaxID=2067455 RepID=UPI000C7C09BF|nr:hypothetical protein [Novosphingobium sp. TH158]PLK27104.1 hypothetical protein C0V78_09570 [Novosphingobium sp. TH158]
MNGTMAPFSSASAGSASGPLAGAGRASFGQASVSSMGMKWSALHDAAGIVATLAGMPPEPMRPEVRNFPAVIRDAGGWRREQAEQGVEDLAVIMEAGIGALLAVHARGIDSRAAALSLWTEFQSARAALLELVPQARDMRRPF